MSKAKSKLTKKAYLEQASNPDLSKVILNYLHRNGVLWSELVTYIDDYQDASCGISGFIFYTDTNKLAKRNLLLFIRAIHNFEQETGSPLTNMPTDDEENYLNFLAWFALESVTHEIQSILEQ
jgi:hypothetical protein